MKGFVRQRKAGAPWTACWETRDPATGRRVQHSKGGFRIKRDAEKHLSRVVGKVIDGAWKPDAPITVEQLLRGHWLPAMRSRGLRPATLSQYTGAVDWWLTPNIGALRAAAVTPNDVSRLVEKLRSGTTRRPDGLSARSVQCAVATLKSATSWAARNDLLARDPLAAYDVPRREHKPMHSWSTEEAREFLVFVRGDRLEAAWALFLTRGLRRGEVAGLRWDQVNLKERLLRVTRTRITVDGHALESVPKTNAGRRTVPLDSNLVELLRAHAASQKVARISGDDHVFTDELGRPWHPDYFTDRFAELVAVSGLPKIRLHDTRHTAASLMLAAGVPVKIVSEMLGHASPSITLALYQHTTPSMGREAGEQLSASLLG